MTIFGVDVASYQAGFNFAQAKAEGFDFAIIKAIEGDNYINPYYGAQYAASVAAGLVTASYVFVHTADEAGEIALAERVIPAGSTIVLDSEADGAGEYPVSVDMYNAFTAAGYHVPLVYFPHWFWQQIGSPSLAGLPALWSSGYPSSATTYASEIYDTVGGDSGSGWTGYGGLGVEMWQFTDRGVVAGISGMDCSAYRGTREQLISLFTGGGRQPAAATTDQTNFLLLEG
ncbi:glycoside hydrolase family 25 protein [Kutzneria albida]|uniref:Lysozyme n=1 Tax=Kutzneria albida DSM 43870 TaxID=1449976 RepID=W5WCR0_9PSEU|nr:glycoside hydrolase family 25 protein [Kutzneria albida]AHH98341.1 hypothetical protein KALB_4979 [Kutzneria albida DSM 43870]